MAGFTEENELENHQQDDARSKRTEVGAQGQPRKSISFWARSSHGVMMMIVVASSGGLSRRGGSVIDSCPFKPLESSTSRVHRSRSSQRRRIESDWIGLGWVELGWGRGGRGRPNTRSPCPGSRVLGVLPRMDSLWFCIGSIDRQT